MLSKEQLKLLSQISEPVLTTYLDVRPGDPSRHARVPPFMTWLRNEADSASASLPTSEKSAFHEQLTRVENFLSDRTAQEKGLVIVSGPDVWETLSLQVPIVNELHWGKPALSQLLWLSAEHRPICVVVVDHSGTHFFSYELGSISPLEQRKFEVDVSQWKREDIGHVARPGIEETYGSQRDVFEHRMEAQYERLCRETAGEILRLFKTDRFKKIILVGPQRLIDLVAAGIPPELHRHVMLIKKDLAKQDLSKLREHIEPEIARWEQELEVATVRELLESERGAVLGIDEVLTQLQNRRVRTLTLCRDIDTRLHQCETCHWIDASADVVCRVCGGPRCVVTLRDVLPELAASSEAELKVVSSGAAERLKNAGGIGGWLRQPKHRAVAQSSRHKG